MCLFSEIITNSGKYYKAQIYLLSIWKQTLVLHCSWPLKDQSKQAHNIPQKL